MNKIHREKRSGGDPPHDDSVSKCARIDAV